MPGHTVQADFAAVKAQGLGWQDMLNNLDNHAKGLGIRLAECIRGSKVVGDLDEIHSEAVALKLYRVAFIDFLMDELKKPEYNKNSASP